MPSRNYRHAGTTILGVETTTNELERLELENGAVKTTVAGGVNVTNTFEEPVPTDETLYESFTLSDYEIAISNVQTGAALPSGVCKGFLLLAPLDNTGDIWIGDSAGNCIIQFPPGTRKSYALPDTAAIFAYAVEDEDTPQKLIVERYF